jgi:hypothetical protein
MTRHDRYARWFAGALFVAAAASGTLATAADDSALLAADAALVRAVTTGDGTAARSLLDAEVTWTDAQGRTLGPAQLAQALPTLAIADEAGAEVRRFEYGRVGVVQVDRERWHALRVWARRSAGWRLLLYQEVRSLPAPPTASPSTGKECDNPCRRVPYEAKSANERGVIAAYQALETSAHGADASTWGTHVADEFILVSANSDRTFDKPTRLAAVGRASFGGVQPTRLLSARMFDFGTAVVMRSQHEPDTGNRLQIARVWISRNGVWQSTLSYQTSIPR